MSSCGTKLVKLVILGPVCKAIGLKGKTGAPRLVGLERVKTVKLPT
jgi:hypothetical protein